MFYLKYRMHASYPFLLRLHALLHSSHLHILSSLVFQDAMSVNEVKLVSIEVHVEASLRRPSVLSF